MIDKKTFVLAVAVSWVLTLATVLLISNFVPSLTQPLTQQTFTTQSIKVVNLQKQEVMNMQKIPGIYLLQLNFSWSPLNPTKNAILGIFLSFESKFNILEQLKYMQVSVRINEFFEKPKRMSVSDTNGEWNILSFQIVGEPEWIRPNQIEYPIKLNLETPNNQTLIRNVNLMLLVTDG